LDSLVFAAVLFAAACHAGWNAAIKIGSDTLSTTALIAIGAGIVGVALLPFVGAPLAAAWSWVAASVIIHLFYFIGLSEGYRVGDPGQVYPLARGTAPLMTATLSVPLVGEALGPLGWGGIFALASGVFLLSARGGHGLVRFDARATGFALFTAITICAYSLVDGIGARLARVPIPPACLSGTGSCSQPMLWPACAERCLPLWRRIGQPDLPAVDCNSFLTVLRSGP
jgi:hypothetical protein